MKKQILASVLIFLFLIVGTVIAIFYGKGYSINFDQGKPELSGTGLLVATSSPDGAEVIIDGHLTTATNNTINLIPGTYKVEIYKQGYFPWTKTITVQKEVVNKADALLLPTAPQLQSITDTGITNPVIDPTLTKIAYTVSSQSAVTDNGIYVFNMSGTNLINPLGTASQIIDDSNDAFSTSLLSWSPDGQSLIATVSSSTKNTTYLLQANGFNSNPSDITETISDIQSTWAKQISDKKISAISGLNSKLKQIVKNDFDILSWSADQTKILYVASVSATIPQIITPALLGVDSTPEDRNIESGKIYVYDIKEDRNYPIDFTLPDSTDTQMPDINSIPIRWLPDSKHLVLVENRKIEVAQYDFSNKTTVYAGPFVDSFVYPWPDGSKLVILTNLGNDQITPNLYTIGLK